MRHPRACPGCESTIGTELIDGDWLCTYHADQARELMSRREDDDSWQMWEGDF